MVTNISRAELQLLRGRLRPLFLRYAVPGVVSMLFLALQSVADGIIVGRLINATALAAVNIVTPVYALVTAVAVIIGVGTQAQMGIHMGSGNYIRAKVALHSGILGVAAFVIPATIFVNCFADEIVVFLGANKELLPLSKSYIHGVMPLLFGVGGFMFCDYQLKALGHPRYAMIIMVMTIVLNILFGVVFVKMGMGTFGVGLGLGLSFTIGLAASGSVIWWEVRHTPNLHHAKGPFSGYMLWRIAYNGSSEGLAEVSIAITMFLFNRTLMEYAGTDGVAAFTLINYILFVGVNVMFGVANGVIPIISYNFGAKRGTRIMGVSRLAVRSNLLVGVALILALWIFGRQIIGIFIPPTETHVTELAVNGVRIVSLAFLFNGFNLFAASFFTAVDDALLSLMVGAMRGLIFLVIGIFTLPYLWGVTGIWLTTPVAEILTMLVVFYFMKRWRRSHAGSFLR
ncbi:MATE family efflux transporter [Phocaeicola dorei]|uniref:MATE family efflux transporter n=1 Tax=Phocaeicola dorei TaxID=357276 RepID=UPI0039B3D297